MIIITILRQIWYKSTTLAWFSQIIYFFKTYHFIHTNIKIRYFEISLPKKYFCSRYVQKANFSCKLYSKHFPKNWLIWNFNSKFGSKRVSLEVKLKWKIAFHSICHKIFGWFRMILAFQRAICLGGVTLRVICSEKTWLDIDKRFLASES